MTMATTETTRTVGSGTGSPPQVLAVPEQVAVPAHKPDGPLSAVLLAAGIGAFFLGLFTTLAEASADFKSFLQLDDGVGPLSGKTVFATALFLVSWAVLTPVLARRDGTLRTAALAMLVLTVVGFVLTFPPVFQAFE
jgi:hypothetical protein